MKNIDGAYDHWKAWIHNLPKSKGKELHHIWGRIGIRKCCPYLMEMLTHSQHEDWKVLKQLRVERLELKKQVEDNYVKGDGCYTPEGGKPVSGLCLDCPMYRGKREI